MRRFLLIAGLAGLTGCAHFESHPLVPAQTAAQLGSRRLDDPGLRRFLEQNLGHPLGNWPLPEWDLPALSLAAFYYQPSLAVARAQWAVSAAGIKTAGGRPNPVVSITPGYDTTATTISPWLPIINFDWPLETAGKRGKRIAAAAAQADSARWDIITAAWQVRGSVRDALLDWQLANQRAAMLDQQIALQEQLIKRLQQRSAAGDIARPELVTAQIALQKIQLDQADAQMKSSEAHTRLAGAIGLGADALAGVRLAADFNTGMPASLTAPEVRRMALVSRSDVLGALADYAAAEAGLRLEIAKQYPDVHLSPGYQYNQGDNQWMLGLSVELPVLNQNQGPIAEAEARRKLAAAKFLALQATVIGEIDQAVAGYSLAQKQLGSGETLVKTEQAQQSSLKAQLQAGAADQFDLLGAQLEESGAELMRLDLVAQAQRARGALEDALQHPLDEFTGVALQHITLAPAGKESQP